MKKLMVMLAAVAIAACGQAATVSWSAGQVYDGSSMIAKGSTGYIGLLCLYNDNAGVSSSALSAYLKSGDYPLAEKIAKINAARQKSAESTETFAPSAPIKATPAAAPTPARADRRATPARPS